MEAIFYKDRNNDVMYTLFNNGVQVSPAVVTKIEFKWSSGAIDSVANPAMFTFEATFIRLKFGSLPAGAYRMNAIVYTADYPAGVVWDTDICVKVKDL